MELLKKFQFWLPLVYVAIGFLNLVGIDDKNLLLFFTSPFGWMAEQHWFVVTFTHPSNIIFLIFLISLVIWFLVGLVIDMVLNKIKSKK